MPQGTASRPGLPSIAGGPPARPLSLRALAPAGMRSCPDFRRPSGQSVRTLPPAEIPKRRQGCAPASLRVFPEGLQCPLVGRILGEAAGATPGTYTQDTTYWGTCRASPWPGQFQYPLFPHLCSAHSFHIKRLLLPLGRLRPDYRSRKISLHIKRNLSLPCAGHITTEPSSRKCPRAPGVLHPENSRF